MATSDHFDATASRGFSPVRDDDAAHSASFEAFVRDQYHGLVTFLRRRTASVQDAEDAAQESMARLLRYHDSTPASAWQRLLFRIAINVAHDQYRVAVSHRANQHVSLDDTPLANPGLSPEERTDQNQQLATLRDAIRSLPPKCRKVYLLKRVYGMSHAEVASRCGISTKMVEKHLAKALAKLRCKVGTSAPETFE